jgi:signal peptidase I
MWPTIHDGDEIALLKAPVLFLFIKRGDIITFRDPSGEEQIPLAKRVIGLPGDVVHLKDGKVFVNDGELDESYLLIHDPEVELLCRVPPAAYFVLGDNRPGSLDSSRLGPIPVSLIKGKVLTIGPHIMVRDLVARSN